MLLRENFGSAGKAAAKAMEILVALGEVFDAEALLPVRSVQVAGVSYGNLGDEGLAYLEELAEDGRAVVPATLNPAGMDLRAPERMGLDPHFVEKQRRVIVLTLDPTCIALARRSMNWPRNSPSLTPKTAVTLSSKS